MKTDVSNVASVNVVDPAISLEGFIVKETLAQEALKPKAVKPVQKTVFTPADLWNIRRRGRYGRVKASRS